MVGWSRRLGLVVLVVVGVVFESQTANISTQLTEVDIVFPRNEAYRRTEVIPIVLAVQNLPTWKANNTTVEWRWDITPYSLGYVPLGVTYDSGVFEVLPNDSPATDPTFLIAVTNVTNWYQGFPGKTWGEKNVLTWAATWNNADNRCAAARFGNNEAIMFDVELSDNNEGSARYNYTNGVAADIPLAPACPKLDQVAQVTLKSDADVGAMPVHQRPNRHGPRQPLRRQNQRGRRDQPLEPLGELVLEDLRNFDDNGHPHDVEEQSRLAYASE